ncbi:MAG: YbdD/YjiX family protein [Arthrobacter sp.]|nr:YbdD/YjiX family protein [Arthrobacter sp.]
MSSVSPAPRREARGPLTWLRGVGRYLNGVLGGDRYARYLEFHARHHAGTAPLSEREYWRAYHAHQDAHPEGRCC